jgi:4-methyl-5(b-hydroxyethyl)-thiazole monophosphate biosynthesis
MSKAAVVLAEGFEEIEAITPIDVLRRAGVEVIVAGLKGKKVKGSHGITVPADIKLSELKEEVDALVLPGGLPGAENLAASKALTRMIRQMNEAGRIVAAICASPAYVLAPTGVLDGKRATGYPGTQDRFPESASYFEDAVVRDGNVITSRGPATALEFSLKLVQALVDTEKAVELRSRMLAH